MDLTEIVVAALAGGLAGILSALIVGNFKERKARFALVMGGTFVVLGAIANAYVLPIIRSWQAAAQVEAAKARRWKTYPIGESGLSIALPGPPQPQSVELAPETQQLTSSVSVYKYEGDGIYIIVTEAIYASGVRADLEGAVRGALANMSRQTGGGLTHSRAETQIEGRPGATVNLQIRSEEQSFDGRGLFVTEANRAWSAILIYPPEQTAGEEFASRVIGSVSFAPMDRSSAVR